MLLVVVFLLTSLPTLDMPFFLLKNALRDDLVVFVVFYMRAIVVVVVILFG